MAAGPLCSRPSAPARTVLCSVVLLFLTGLPAGAQERSSAAGRDESGPPTAVSTAPVTLDGRVLFTLRGTSAYPAAERTARVAKLVRGLAASADFDPADLSLVEEGSIARIMADDRVVISLVDADARLEGVTRHELALVALGRIREAIEHYRTERKPEALVAVSLRVIGATVVVALGLAFVLWLRRRLDRWIAARVQERLRSLGAESVQAGSSERVGELARSALRGLRLVVVLAALFLYVEIVLSQFPWTRPLHVQLRDWVVGPLETMGRAVVNQIPNLVFLVLLCLVLRWATRLIRLFFEAVGRGAVTLTGFEPDWAMPTYKLVRLAVIAFGVVVAYPYIPGSRTDAFKGLSILAGVALSIGSSPMIGNTLAGYILIYRRAFRAGDRVRIGAVTGDVVSIRPQATDIRTPKNEQVVVPNSVILGSDVVNYSTLARSRGLILHTTVGIGYETPWRQVESMLLLAAGRTPGLLREPAPFVLQTSLGDFAVTYELNVYCDQPQSMAGLYTELHRQILDAFNEYGVAIMTPAYVADPEEPKVVPRHQWFAAPAAVPLSGAGGDPSETLGGGEDSACGCAGAGPVASPSETPSTPASGALDQ